MVASHEPPQGVVDLPSAGVPSDHGLASLGLVMQLAGRATGAFAALIASIVVLESRVHRPGWFFVAVGLCIARSQYHRIAGRDLVFGRRHPDGEVADPFHAMRTYIAFGLGHAIALGLIATQLGATGRTGAGITVALALWPIALAVLLRLPRFRPLRAGIPLGEDRGLEGASIIMTILGACGVLSTGAIVLVLGALPSRHLQHGWGAMLVMVFTLLLVRSCMHMRAGIVGLRDSSFDRPGELAGRYASFGVISAVCVAGVLAVFAMSERLTPEAFASVVAIGWLLAIWPMILRRYFSHRQFAELLAGDRILHRRAPDAGLSGLGWLLAGHATVVAALLVLELTVQPRGAGRALDNLLQLTGPVASRSGLHIGLAAGVAALELVAATALLRMTEHRRANATIYALVAGAVTLATTWPAVWTLDHQIFNLRMAIRLVPIAIQLVIPAATLVLVHRTTAPLARARYRRSDKSTGTPGLSC